MAKSIYDLNLHESIKFSDGAESTLDVEITRVPDAWIYNYLHKVIDKEDIIKILSNVLELSAQQLAALQAIKFKLPAIWQSNPVRVPFDDIMKEKIKSEAQSEIQTHDPDQNAVGNENNATITRGNSPKKTN
jgi:hypothetical protein